MQLIKNVLIVGFLLVLASAGVFAMYNRGMFNSVHLSPTTAFAGFFDTAVRPKLPASLAKLLPAQEKSKSKDDSESGVSASDSAKKNILSSEETKEQLSVLTERSQEVSQEIGKVLGDYVQVNEKDENKPLHEKAFEYGQYLYCQQVIKEFEASTPPSPSPSSTPN